MHVFLILLFFISIMQNSHGVLKRCLRQFLTFLSHFAVGIAAVPKAFPSSKIDLNSMTLEHFLQGPYNVFAFA